jgi:hypothetical protein
MVKKVLEKRTKNLKNFMCQCRNVAGARRKTHRWTPIRCFSAKMCQHGLSPGTSGVYLGNVRNYASLLGDKMDKEEQVLLHRFQGILERRYAEQKHDSGTAVAAAEANKVLKLLHRKGHYVAACALDLMGLTGLRMVDVHHLRVCDILFKPEGKKNFLFGFHFRLTRTKREIYNEGSQHPKHTLLNHCLNTIHS